MFLLFYCYLTENCFLVKNLFSFKIWNKKSLQNKHGVLVLTRASLGSSLVLKYFWVGGWHPTIYSYLLFICYQTHSFTCSRLNSPCPCRRAETYSCEQSWLFREDATRPLRQLAPEHPRFPELWNTFEKKRWISRFKYVANQKNNYTSCLTCRKFWCFATC